MSVEKLLLVTLLAACSGCATRSGVESISQSSAENPGLSPTKKRAAPAPRQSVMHAGVRYLEVRDGKGRGLSQNSGYLEAIDTRAGTSLWLAKIYDVHYGDIEDDKSEIYFASMKLDRAERQLTIVNEREERYTVALVDGHVVRIR